MPKIRLIACHSSLVAHMEQHLHTIQILSCQRSINRNQFLIGYRITKKYGNKSNQHKPNRGMIGAWEVYSEYNSKNKSHLRSRWVNRRTQFKLIAIKSGTDSNLLSVTSYAAGLLESHCWIYRLTYLSHS